MEQHRQYRENLGISLRKMAKKMSISASYLSDLEQGKRNWNPEVEKKWRRAVWEEEPLEEEFGQSSVWLGLVEEQKK